jgi:hypothetical protein
LDLVISRSHGASASRVSAGIGSFKDRHDPVRGADLGVFGGQVVLDQVNGRP